MNKPITSGAAGVAARRDVWTRHWATGAAHSCVGSYGDRYEGEIAAFWRSRFADLKAGQRVLDIATGNGALPRLLLQERAGVDVEIDAVDIAAVSPPWLAGLPPSQRQRVRFHGNQGAESLPFADGAFDLIVSQYGLEYTDLERATAELLRVSAPGARLVLLMHRVDSRPVALARTELTHLNWLLSADGLLAAARDILDPIGRAATAEGRARLAADATALAARDRFNAAQDTLRTRAQSEDGADVLFEVQSAVSESLALALQGRRNDASARLQSALLAAEDARLRLEELCKHALCKKRLDAICDGIRPAVIELSEVWERGHLMGCTLSARLGRCL